MAFDGVMRGTVLAAALVVAACASVGCSGHSKRLTTPRGGDATQADAPGGTPKSWGAPVLWDDFGGTALDTRKWQVYQAPDASSHRGIAAGTHVSGGVLDLVGGVYGGRDQGAGVISRL